MNSLDRKAVEKPTGKQDSLCGAPCEGPKQHGGLPNHCAGGGGEGERHSFFGSFAERGVLMLHVPFRGLLNPLALIPVKRAAGCAVLLLAPNSEHLNRGGTVTWKRVSSSFFDQRIKSSLHARHRNPVAFAFALASKSPLISMDF